MSRKSKRTFCRKCNTSTITGLDADRAGIPVTVNARPLTALEIASNWPDVYLLFQGELHEFRSPRPIQAWETVHAVHRCEENQ